MFQPLYKSNIMSVSEFVCHNSSKMTKLEELKYREMITLGMQNVLG